MSEDEREIDVESEDEDYSRPGSGAGPPSDKRAHHNALERKRRDHIKDSFTGLRDAIPTMKGGDKSSRAQILKKASEYIQFMRRKNSTNQMDLDDLKRQNTHLEAQIRALERAKSTGNFASAADILNDQGLLAEGENLPTDDLSTATGNNTAASGGGTSTGAARVVAPGQSLLLTNGTSPADPPKKKMKI